ncbi:hypothetical protein C8R45DRAFT_1070416 [Mycena sanguinolenta]|nr:hypothetical protein C8R45DRAFT_1070416 [Mycena sanguinolenta]
MKNPKHALDWFRRKTLRPPASESTPMPSTEDTATKAGNKTEWAFDGFNLALDLAEQALDIAQVAPFVGPAAVLLHKIIDSFKEWKHTDEKRDLLAQRVADLTGDICATVLRMEETNYSHQIGRLKQDLEKYAMLVNRASEFIEHYDAQGKLPHFAQSKEKQETLDKLLHSLDLSGARFGMSQLLILY